jgi:hypothetical protein
MLLVQRERKFYDNRIVHNQKELLGELLELGRKFEDEVFEKSSEENPGEVYHQTYLKKKGN